MKKITEWIQRHCEKAWFCVCANICLLAVLLLLFSPAYETNDDMGLCAIVNGVKGTYDAHMIYVNYLIGLLLTRLYRVTDAVSWYALLQYAALLCAFSAVTYVEIRRFRKRPSGWIFAAVLLLFAYEGYIRLQYTKTAGIVSAAGMILLLDAVTGERIRKRSAVCGIVLAGFGAMYRLPQFFAEAFLMLGIVIYELINLRQLAPGAAKKRLGRYVGAAAALLGVVAVLYGADRLAYRSEEWQRYEEYNAARTELFDYGFPDYEKNRETYEELEIDENAYQLIRGWNHMDTEKFSVEIMEELIAKKTPVKLDLRFVKGFIKKVLLKLYTVPGFWCFLLVLLVWLFSVRHRRQDIAAILGEFFAVGLLYCFLYYQGRYLRNRVDVGIWMAATMTVLWILAPGGAFPRGKIMRVCVNAVGPALCILLTLAAHGVWEKRLRINTADERQKQSVCREVLEYIASDGEHLYLTKSGAVSLAKSYGVFDSIPAGLMENTLALGGWPANTPGYVEKMREYGITNPFRDMIGNEQIYLVDDDVQETLAYLRTYYDADVQAALEAEPGNAKIYRIG